MTEGNDKQDTAASGSVAPPCSAGFLFDPGKPEPRARRKPRKLMHVLDAGPAEDDACMVVMSCRRCDLTTEWFRMPSVTAAKRGFPCPKCNGGDFATNQYNEYVPAIP